MAIDIRIDDRIRLVASVLLLSPFADENPGWKPHPLKTRTVAFLQPHRDHQCAVVSREIAERWWMSALYCYAVLLESVDRGFARRPEAAPTGYDTAYVQHFEERGYAGLLRDFWGDTGIAQLWDETADRWHEVREDCRGCVQSEALEEFLDLLFGTLPFTLTMIPNPLDPPTFGFGPNDGRTAYALWGPPAVSAESAEPVRYASYGAGLTYDAFHEFGHTLWSETLRSYPALVERTRPLESTMSLRGWFPEMYPSWEQRLDEIVLRAAEALYHEWLGGAAAGRAVLQRAREEHGIDVIDVVHSSLHRYLQARQRGEYDGLGDYLPTLAEECTARCAVP